MKYKSKIYAKALTDSISNKKNTVEQKKIVDNFLSLLVKNGDMKKIKEIISLAEDLFLEKTGNKNIILETARKIDTKNLLKYLFKRGDIIEEKINSELVAGVKVIINNEMQFDFSLKNKLDSIF